MKFIGNKMKIASSALILMLTMAAALITCLPVVNAHTPPWYIPTYAYLTAAPNPIGKGQTLALVMWLDKYPPTANGQYGDRWHNFTVTVKKPNGSTQMLGPFDSDPVGTRYTPYVPDQTGNYTFQFTFLGQTLAGENPNPSPFDTYKYSPYIGDYYKPSSSVIVTVTVQQEPVPEPITYSLPASNQYWTRPIEGENTQWGTIAGNWLGGSSNVGRVQPYSTSPKSPHIVWAKPIAFGGVVGGNINGNTGMTYYSGITYENYWGGGFVSPIIIQGRLYYNAPIPPMYGFNCLDLRTGELIWWHNGTGPSSGYTIPFGTQSYPQLSFGQILDYESPNQHGAVPAYLWSAPASGIFGFMGGTMYMFDAFTGNWICNFINVPGGTVAYAPDGSILIYVLDPSLHWLAEWNSTAAMGNPPPYIENGYWMWRPPLGGTVDAGVTSAYSWNVTLPALPEGSSFTAILPDRILGTGPLTAGGMFGFGTNNPYTIWTLNLKPGHIGELMWMRNYTAPAGNVTLSMGPVDPATSVFTMRAKETINWYGFSLSNGTQLWGPTTPETAWDMYDISQVGGVPSTVAYGKLYTASYGGILYCYDLKTGNRLWSYTGATNSGFNTVYGDYPLSIGAVADGKIYVYTTEHSPDAPPYKGARLRCVDAYSGEELWTVLQWAAPGPIIADGYLVSLNDYDNQIYCFGKGQTATTVSAPQTTVANGSSVLIQGTVMDESPGAKDTPAISDVDMGSWMEYLYMQKPCPADVTGVPVTLQAMRSDGSIINIATVISDVMGHYEYVWTPPAPDTYKVLAIFAGSDSYFTSSAQVGLSVGPAPPAAPSAGEVANQVVSQLPTVTPIDVVIIAAVVVVAILVIYNIISVRKLRK